MYRDSEMVIWFSSGRGLVDFAAPLFRFAWPVLLLIAVLALVVWPWANSQTQGMRDRTSAAATSSGWRPASSRNRPAATACSSSTRTRPTAATANNIFISAIERDKQIVTSARSGRIETVGGDRFLMLQQRPAARTPARRARA